MNWNTRYIIGRIAGVEDCPCGLGLDIQNSGITLVHALDLRTLYPTGHSDFSKMNKEVRKVIDSLVDIHNRAYLSHGERVLQGEKGYTPANIAHHDHMGAHLNILNDLQAEERKNVPFSEWKNHGGDKFGTDLAMGG